MNEFICDIEAKLLDILNNRDIWDIVSIMFSYEWGQDVENTLLPTSQ